MESQKKVTHKTINPDDSEDKYRIYSSLAFLTVVVIIGVPMWWKTTEVYRVSLPYSAIKSLGASSLKISQSVGIFTFDPNRSASIVEELRMNFQNSDLWNIKFVQINNVDDFERAKTPALLESLILKNFHMRPGDFLFLEWPKLTDEALITTDRSALINKEINHTKIIQILKIHVLQMYKIQSIVDEKKQYGFKGSPPQPHYDVLISVLNPNPEKLDFSWNVRLASEMYLSPFLENINQVSQYTLKSQWRYQTSFEHNVKLIRTNSKLGRQYALGEENLPHIITSIEKNLGGGISDRPVIHLVVYVPPCDISPLYIYRDGKQITSGNVQSFISPKWGGVIIYNPPEDLCLQYNENQSKISFNISSNDVMQVALYQMQKLIDIQSDMFIDGIKVVAIEKLAPRVWESESYIRRSAVNRLMTATRTLQSLISLLDNISYIVINDDVGTAINEAYREILLAIEHLNNNELLKASNAAKKAFISSEHAFFDASLLAQLYFPDEQKYAIYIPLFLPIMVPVITSLAYIKKYFVKSPENE